jgi:hypothetical protein
MYGQVRTRHRLACFAAAALTAVAATAAHAGEVQFRIPFKNLKSEVALSITPESYDFGNVPLNGTATQTFQVMNSGGTTVSGLTYSWQKGTGAFSASGCGSSLGPGQVCSETVVYSANARATVKDTLLVSNGQHATSLDVTGTGQLTDGYTDVGSLAFGNVFVGQSATKSVNLKNDGDTVIGIGTLQTSPVASYSAAQSCGTNLSPGQSCLINVTFSPATRSASIPGNLTIPTSAGNKTVSLSGAGLQASFTASPSAVTFDNTAINGSENKSFTVTNVGNATGTVGLTGPSGAFSIAGNTCGALAAGANCTVTVRFAPTVSGTTPGSISVTGGDVTVPVSLSGPSNCTPGGQAFTSNGTFYPTAGCGTYLALAVGGGAGGMCAYQNGGGSGRVNIQYANNLTSAVGVTVGGPGGIDQWGNAYSGAQSCFGGICAAGGSAGGAGGSGGGNGWRSGSGGGPGYGGSWGNSSSDGTGAGQGNYSPYTALFHQHSVAGGAGGTPAYIGSASPGYEGGGGGGILFDNWGPSGGADAGGAGNASGTGWGAGGGGGWDQGYRGQPGWCVGGGPGAQGLVYVEWSK